MDAGHTPHRLSSSTPSSIVGIITEDLLLFSEMSEQQNEKREKLLKEIFEDYEARSNIVGLYSLLLSIDRRIDPRHYARRPRHD